MLLHESLPKDATSPARARRLLGCLADRVEGGCLADARLLVSEVVTNAVEHVPTDGEIEMSVCFEGGRLRVEVSDPGAGFQYRDRDPQSDRGWGLLFVDRLSDRWGIDDKVWFELTA